MATILDPAQGKTQFAYDAHHRVLTEAAPNGASIGVTYNGFGDAVTRVSPDTGTTQARYDLADNVTSSTDGAGVQCADRVRQCDGRDQGAGNVRG